MKVKKALLTAALVLALLNLSCGFGGYTIHLGTYQEAYAARLALNPLKSCSPLMFQAVWNIIKKEYITPKTDKELWLYSLQGLSATTKTKITKEVPPNPNPMKFWLLRLAPAAAVSPQTYEKLCYGSINGIIKGLNDKYSHFFTVKDGFKKMEKILGNSDYVGLGFTMVVDKPNKRIWIEGTQPNSPARRVFKRFDEIISVDGIKIKKKNWKKGVSVWFHGKRGTKVTVVFHRGRKLYKKTFVRQGIVYKNSQCRMIGEIPYCKIHQFRRNTMSDFKEQFSMLPTHKKKIIIDFRGNGGGLIYSATNLLSQLWLGDKMSTIIVKRPFGAVGHADGTTKKVLLKGYKTIVLQDGRSASAAEMCLAAIKDYKVATLMGEKSFGKGIVQNTKILYGAVLTYTTWFFISPYGMWIHKYGITPDIKMPVTMKQYIDGRDPLLKAAIQRLK